jgi:hypothetical protein
MLAAACGDIVSLATGKPRSELAILLLQNSAPAPAGTTFYVSNARVTTRSLSHPDGANTLFMRLTFPQGSLATFAGRAAVSTDSVQVSVSPVSGTYAFNLAASGVTFSAANTPTATFSYGSYGDFAASRAGSRYASSIEYAQALTIWREEILDRLNQVVGSGASGVDGVGGSVQGPGTYYAAAPK